MKNLRSRNSHQSTVRFFKEHWKNYRTKCLRDYREFFVLSVNVNIPQWSFNHYLTFSFNCILSIFIKSKKGLSTTKTKCIKHLTLDCRANVATISRFLCSKQSMATPQKQAKKKYKIKITKIRLFYNVAGYWRTRVSEKGNYFMSSAQIQQIFNWKWFQKSKLL